MVDDISHEVLRIRFPEFRRYSGSLCRPAVRIAAVQESTRRHFFVVTPSRITYHATLAC
ncbi:hypothetical protein OG709_01630 [Streptomyces sp. NBC_01267]|uniref:hypothetical protein n=1 Tax=Streptomyces sp. NBC_01267 TaxID=2903805 RepID=UPI002E32D2CE|nr:hypothetical protein [Streptomyces sp. NBC_01267]